jgi:hypothetical protein
MDKLGSDLDEKDAEVEDLKTSALVPRSLHYEGEHGASTSTCAYRAEWWPVFNRITYDSWVGWWRKGSALNLDTGVFTCKSAGQYTIDYSGLVVQDSDEMVCVIPWHNGEKLNEGHLLSWERELGRESWWRRTLVTLVITPLKIVTSTPHSLPTETAPRCRRRH